jgi:hypothetical protein
MNFPLQYPIFQFFYWLVNTPGVGGTLVIIIGGLCSAGAFLILRWISRAAKIGESETSSFPSPDFHTEQEK